MVVRYSLIVSDEKYMELMKLAQEHGMTLGKYLNHVLDEHIERVRSGSEEVGEETVLIEDSAGKIRVVPRNDLPYYLERGWRVKDEST